MPTDMSECKALSDAYSDLYDQVNAVHQQCLDGSADDSRSGQRCSKARCEGVHNQRDELMQRKNQAVGECNELVRAHQAAVRAQEAEARAREQEQARTRQFYEQQLRDQQSAQQSAQRVAQAEAQQTAQRLALAQAQQRALKLTKKQAKVQLATGLFGAVMSALASGNDPPPDDVGDESILPPAPLDRSYESDKIHDAVDNAKIGIDLTQAVVDRDPVAAALAVTGNPVIGALDKILSMTPETAPYGRFLSTVSSPDTMLREIHRSLEYQLDVALEQVSSIGAENDASGGGYSFQGVPLGSGVPVSDNPWADAAPAPESYDTAYAAEAGSAYGSSGGAGPPQFPETYNGGSKELGAVDVPARNTGPVSATRDQDVPWEDFGGPPGDNGGASGATPAAISVPDTLSGQVAASASAPAISDNGQYLSPSNPSTRSPGTPSAQNVSLQNGAVTVATLSSATATGEAVPTMAGAQQSPAAGAQCDSIRSGTTAYKHSWRYGQTFRCFSNSSTYLSDVCCVW